MVVPMNTIFPEDEFDDWLKIIAKEPFAFNGADLTDRNDEVIQTLHLHNKCVCGATVDIPINPDNNKPYPIMMCEGVEGTIKRNGKLISVRKCISAGTFRKFVWHSIPED